MLIGSGISWAWIVCAVPAIWFVGMFLSHIVLKKCALNWVAQKLKSNKPRWANKAKVYKQGAPISYRKNRPLSPDIQVDTITD